MKQVDLINCLYNKTIINDTYINLDVSMVTNDSRKVEDGACFIAIRGEHFDGHKALSQVIQEGAKLLVVEEIPEDFQKLDASIVKVPSTYRMQATLANKFYQEPSKRLDVVAVTGTNGKTTTTNMINQMLEALNHKTGLIGTLHNKIDQQLIPTVNTTPDALILQSLFAKMIESQCDTVILEASSHALKLGRLSYTDVNCAIFTNISREHLDFHHTMEDYAYAKSLLFSQLGQQFENDKAKLAILNLDDPYYELMASVTSAEIVSYSLANTQATVYAHDIHTYKGQTQFVLNFMGQKYNVLIPMRGSYNVSNFLAAFLCLYFYYQYSIEDILDAFSAFTGVSGRMQRINRGQEFEVIVDFAHTTDALERVLKDIKRFKQVDQDIVVLMGHSGGNRDSAARPELGDILFKYADRLVFTADNPRFETVEKICQEMVGSHREKPYTIIEDRKEAIDFTIKNAKNTDIILFAGKGGEPYQVIGDDYIPFNEAEIVAAMIEKYIS